VRFDIEKRDSINIQLNGLKNVVSLDYDYEGQTLFYADITLDKIMRLNISSGKQNLFSRISFFAGNMVIFYLFREIIGKILLLLRCCAINPSRTNENKR